MSEELVRLDLAWGAVTRLQSDLDAAVSEHIRVWTDTREAVNKYATDNARLRAINAELVEALRDIEVCDIYGPVGIAVLKTKARVAINKAKEGE